MMMMMIKQQGSTDNMTEEERGKGRLLLKVHITNKQPESDKSLFKSCPSQNLKCLFLNLFLENFIVLGTTSIWTCSSLSF